MYLIYKIYLYHDKQYELDTLFIEYHVPLFEDIDNPVLIGEWKQNLDAAAYEKIEQSNKVTIKEEINQSS